MQRRAGPRGRPRDGRLDVEVRISALDVGPGQPPLAALALEHDQGLQHRHLGPRRWNTSRSRPRSSATFVPRASKRSRDLLGRRGRVEQVGTAPSDISARSTGSNSGGWRASAPTVWAGGHAELRQPAGQRVDAIAQLGPRRRASAFVPSVRTATQSPKYLAVIRNTSAIKHALERRRGNGTTIMATATTTLPDYMKPSPIDRPTSIGRADEEPGRSPAPANHSNPAR